MDLTGVKRRPLVANEVYFTPHLHFPSATCKPGSIALHKLARRGGGASQPLHAWRFSPGHSHERPPKFEKISKIFNI